MTSITVRRSFVEVSPSLPRLNRRYAVAALEFIALFGGLSVMFGIYVAFG